MPEKKGIVIRGIGIDTEKFSPTSVDAEAVDNLREEFAMAPGNHCILMVCARLVWSKGVREFLVAAQTLQLKHPGWTFILVAPEDPGSPDTVPQSFVTRFKDQGIIVINNFRHDIVRFVAMSDIVVLPSYYPEGVPQTLLEGLAMGKPVVTTDHPGCREVVDEGKNGYLVPIRDCESFILRLESLMEDAPKREEFGRHSRFKAVTEFSQDIVNNRIINEAYELS